MVLPALPKLPQFFFKRLKNSQEFRSICRQLNHIFSFTQMGATSKSFIDLPVPSGVTLQGRTYHVLKPFADSIDIPFWYLLDTEYRSNTKKIEKLIRRNKLPKNFIKILTDTVLNAMQKLQNPFYQMLKSTFQINSVSRKEEEEKFQIIIHPKDRPTGISEVGSVRSVPKISTNSKLQPRMVFSKWFDEELDEPEYIDILSAELEPLAYPILFPCGSLGWHSNMLIDGHKLTLQKYLRQLLLREERFHFMNRLTQEFVVDMHSRMEDERLQYIKNAQKQHSITGETQTDETIIAEGGAQPSSQKIYLPSSFPGSFRRNHLLLENGLARVRQYGLPQLFITMTCNPNWPEIKDRLLPGQTAADRPLLVARVFHKKLMEMREDIKKLFGGLQYRLDVIEFQKRCLPHIHELICLLINILQTMAEIDKWISAEMPREEGVLKDLVQKYMIHNHSDRCGARVALTYERNYY